MLRTFIKRLFCNHQWEREFAIDEFDIHSFFFPNFGSTVALFECSKCGKQKAMKIK